MNRRTVARTILGFCAATVALLTSAFAGDTVYVSRMWHQHQPIYWPEWNGNGNQTSRVQYAWDSIVLKGGQTYGTGIGHPDNNLTDIFSVPDRQAAYQSDRVTRSRISTPVSAIA